MQEIGMLETIERYIRGEMLPEERVFFEQLRKTNATVDQMVVEHTVFLNQMNKFGERKNMHLVLNEIHNELFEAGDLKATQKGRVVQLWKKYKKVIAVAASIAGITALAISGLVSYVSPKINSDKTDLLNLYRPLQNTISKQEKKINDLSNKLNEVTKLNETTKLPIDKPLKSGGTGFLIDGRGYLVTNAHVVNNANGVIVQNNNGQQFTAKIVFVQPSSDLAIIKIDDDDFKPLASLPYSISKNNTDLGEQIFTLGYPRDEIVYGEGYMSAKTGFEGDTLACQIAVAANPGNSGGPVLNKNGEVVGVLSTRQVQAQGVVFAIRSKNIFKALYEYEFKGDSAASTLKVPITSTLKGVDRSQQIKKMENCIFMVKTF